MLRLRYRPIVLLAVAAAMLAACQKQEPNSPVANGPSQSAEQPGRPVPASRPVPAPPGQRGADMLAAQGIDLNFPHGVLYDILDTSKHGTPRHRVLLEVTGGGFAAAVAAVDKSFDDLGCQKTRDSNKAGRIDQTYACDGRPPYYLLMQPAGMGPKLPHAGATGSIHVMWTAL